MHIIYKLGKMVIERCKNIRHLHKLTFLFLNYFNYILNNLILGRLLRVVPFYTFSQLERRYLSGSSGRVINIYFLSM